MIRLRKDYPRIPPGGWHYADPSGVNIQGKNAEDLIKNIAEFRLQNSLPPGKPEYEVTLFYVEHHPEFTERTEAEPEIPLKTRSDYLADWTNTLWRHPPKEIMPDKLAAKRIETCLDCSFRREWKPDSALDKEIVRKLIVLSQGHYRPDLGYCTAFRVHCGFLVLIKDPGVRKSPDVCWVCRPDSLVDE